MKKNTKLFVLTIALLFIGSIFLTACSSTPNRTGNLNIPGLTEYGLQSSSATSGQQAATQELREFKSVEELKAFIQENTISNYYGGVYMDGVRTLAMTDMATGAKAASSESAPTANAGGSSAEDFSQTNIQVQGVDEADFIKNDNRYIYMISDNKLIIVDAYDAQNAKIISTTKIENAIDNQNDVNYWYGPTAKEIFINGDKLILFVEVNERTYYFPEYQLRPETTYRQKTYAYIYDISDKSSPELKETFSATGSYYDSRMIDNTVYIITQESVNTYYPEPVIMDATNSKTIKPKIFYFDNPENSYVHNTIVSINLDDDSVIDSKTFMLGYSSTLMVSENNIYIAYQKQAYWPCRFGTRCLYDNYNDDTKQEFYDVVVPLLKGEIKTNIQNIIDQHLSDEEEWSKISNELGKFYENIANDEDLQAKYEDMFGDIEKAKQEYELKKQIEERKTIVHKISIDKGQIEYKAKGEVYGSLLNQFSMDEYDGNLRLATTINAWVGQQIQYNNVYVLDENMKTIGTLEQLGKDERIYSARFLGGKLYLVTYKQVDPLFVIDLSDATDPKVLGYLKITGYSDYLHPYDATHIIGIGKETETNEYGGIITKGLKIALFDVSDFENPKLVDSYEIGDAGTDSPALHDHKAFLFSKTKNIVVLPVSEITEKTQTGMYGAYDYKVWNGAYVFDISPEGFTLKGKVQHSSSTSTYYNWWNQASVLRSLYMDNNLYTVSNKYIKINALDNALEDLKTITLPYSDDRYYVY